MIQAVLQAIPIHHTSFFKIPKKIFDEMNKKMAKLWWGSQEHKIHWSSWATLCEGKFRGGYEFRDLNKFNFALLAKLGWQLAAHPDVLWARLMKGHCYLNGSFLLDRKKEGVTGFRGLEQCVHVQVLKSYVKGCANRLVMIAQRDFERIHGFLPIQTSGFDLKSCIILTSTGCQS